MWECWHEQMISLLDEMAPVKQFPRRKKNLPWLLGDIKALISKSNNLAKKARRTGLVDIGSANEAASLRKIITGKIRYQKKHHASTLLANNRNKEVWRMIR